MIVDIRMPPGHSTEGLDAARQIRSDFPDIAILVLSAHVEVEHAMDLMKLSLPESDDVHRRVLAVLTFLGAG